MLDRITNISNNNFREYVPYATEVNFNIPTTNDDIYKLNEIQEKLKDNLIAVEIRELKPFNASIAISVWKSHIYVAKNIYRLTIKNLENKTISSELIIDTDISHYKLGEILLKETANLLKETLKSNIFEILYFREKNLNLLGENDEKIQSN